MSKETQDHSGTGTTIERCVFFFFEVVCIDRFTVLSLVTFTLHPHSLRQVPVYPLRRSRPIQNYLASISFHPGCATPLTTDGPATRESLARRQRSLWGKSSPPRGIMLDTPPVASTSATATSTTTGTQARSDQVENGSGPETGFCTVSHD